MTITRRSALILGLSGLAACAPVARVMGQSLAPNSRVIIYRHADRDGDDLSAAGHARSTAFAGALDGIPIDAIYSPGIQRNLDTAAPLLTARNLPVSRISGDQIARRLSRLSAGRSIVWVGNRGNLNAIWDRFGFEGPPPLEYGDLFIVETDAAGTVRIDRRRVEI